MAAPMDAVEDVPGTEYLVDGTCENASDEPALMRDTVRHNMDVSHAGADIILLPQPTPCAGDPLVRESDLP